MNLGSGFRPSRKAVLSIVIVILVGGVLIGFVDSTRSMSAGTFAGPSELQANVGSPGENSSGSSGITIPFGYQAESSSTTVFLTTTATESSVTEPGTISIGSSGSSSSTPSQNSAAAPQSNASSSGYIEFFSNVTIQVFNPQSALTRASAIAYTYGGYIAFSSYDNTSSVAVLRIPAENYASALSGVESLGNLTGLQSTSNDVSVKYTDLNATLQSLLTEEASLLKLENSSNSLNSTLLLENQIQGVDSQINEIQSEILQTRLLIDYSTITATFNEQIETPPPPPLIMKLTTTPKTGMSPLAVTFNAIVNGGVSPYIVNYNFGDGSSYQGQTLIHTFTQAGTYNVTVTVTDSAGNVQDTSVMVHVTSVPRASQFSSFASFIAGLLISVVEGIVEVAVVVLPIALVAGAVIIPFRNRLRSSSRKSEGAG